VHLADLYHVERGVQPFELRIGKSTSGMMNSQRLKIRAVQERATLRELIECGVDGLK
jgi:hypothetical protein